MRPCRPRVCQNKCVRSRLVTPWSLRRSFLFSLALGPVLRTQVRACLYSVPRHAPSALLGRGSSVRWESHITVDILACPHCHVNYDVASSSHSFSKFSYLLSSLDEKFPAMTNPSFETCRPVTDIERLLPV
jgi:hypothetical protein